MEEQPITAEVADLTRQEIWPDRTTGYHAVFCEWYLKTLTDQLHWDEIFQRFIAQKFITEEEASSLFLQMLINLESMRRAELPSSLGPGEE